MKTKSVLLILAIIVTVNAYSQYYTIELTFTAKSNGQHVVMDSIFIENLSQGGDTTLYLPDTIFVFDFISGINDNESKVENSFSISQNYPNPFTGKTVVDLYLPEKENINMTLRDILGREQVQYENTLNRGNHTFNLHLAGEKFYFLTVSGKYKAKTIKMLNTANNSTGERKYHIEYKHAEVNATGFKSHSERSNFVFALTDILRYTAYGMYGGEVYKSIVIKDPPYLTEYYEFDFIARMPCPGIPTITYGGQVYKTVLIGDQCWMSENLNIGTMVTGEMTDNGIIEKNCSNDDNANCNEYGGLYQWDEMMQYTTTTGTQGICPPDWHIPSDEEWKILEGTVDSQYSVGDWEWNLQSYRGSDAGKKLKSKSDWFSLGNGNDYFGFTGLPANYNGGTKEQLFNFGTAWWVSDEHSSPYAWYRNLHYSEDGICRFNGYKSWELYVRCIKD